MDYLNSKRWKR